MSDTAAQPTSATAARSWPVSHVPRRRLLALSLVLVLMMAQSLLRLHAIEHAAGHRSLTADGVHSAALTAHVEACEHAADDAEHDHSSASDNADHADDLPWGHEEGSLACQWLDAQLTAQADSPRDHSWTQAPPPVLHVAAAPASPSLSQPDRPYEARAPPLF